MVRGQKMKVVGQLPDSWLLHYADGPWQGWPLTWSLASPLPFVLCGDTDANTTDAEVGQC
jgi:hypothetical protein